jgi:hypothetical protein
VSQYLQFRNWMHTSSSAEKKLGAAALVLVSGLVTWALIPTGGVASNSLAIGPNGGVSGANISSGSQATASGPSASATQGSNATGAAAGPQTPGATAGAAGAPVSNTAGSTVGGGSQTSTGGPASPGCVKSSETGVSATQINLADILLNLAGAIGNSAVGQASPQVQQQMAQAVVDDINSHGGVACRKLVVTYYQANPIDPTSTQNICLQIQQAGVFAVIGGFAYPESANDCLAQQKIPLVANIAPTPSEAKQYYPYMMSDSPDPMQDYANSIFGLKARGWFTSAQGFQKLAILEDDCSTEIDQAVYNDLLQAGVSPSQITPNKFSCPSGGFASPSDMSNFATQDNLAHITNVIEITGGGSFKEYSTAAQQQGYKPHYLVSNYNGFLVTATGGTGPDPNNFDGTVVTTDTRFGETNTPGLNDPATQACVDLFTRHGLPGSYVTGPYLGASNCNLFELFAAAAAHDPGLTRAGLATGLGQLGRVNMAYSTADAIYRAPGAYTPVKVSGGDFWWTIEFYSSCTCWKVIDPTWHPTF